MFLLLIAKQTLHDVTAAFNRFLYFGGGGVGVSVSCSDSVYILCYLFCDLTLSRKIISVDRVISCLSRKKIKKYKTLY